MTIDELQIMAYKVIRREGHTFERTTTDSEFGNYVRGILDLQAEIFNKIIEEKQGDNKTL